MLRSSGPRDQAPSTSRRRGVPGAGGVDLTGPGNGSRIAFNAAGSPMPWIRVRWVVGITAATVDIGRTALVPGSATDPPRTASSWTPSPHGSPMPALRGNGWRVTATPPRSPDGFPSGVPDRSGSGRGRRVSPWPGEGPHDVWNMLAAGGLSVVSLLGRRRGRRTIPHDVDSSVSSRSPAGNSHYSISRRKE
jgi:hypothetical protein